MNLRALCTAAPDFQSMGFQPSDLMDFLSQSSAPKFSAGPGFAIYFCDTPSIRPSRQSQIGGVRLRSQLAVEKALASPPQARCPLPAGNGHRSKHKIHVREIGGDSTGASLIYSDRIRGLKAAATRRNPQMSEFYSSGSHRGGRGLIGPGRWRLQMVPRSVLRLSLNKLLAVMVGFRHT